MTMAHSHMLLFICIAFFLAYCYHVSASSSEDSELLFGDDGMAIDLSNCKLIGSGSYSVVYLCHDS